MQINANLNQNAIVHAGSLEWQPSPMKGVDRRMLERNGDEVARATTIVRYAPESYFAAHTHTGGEEFMVLDGVFSDEHGDFPAGTYVRNPVGTRHTPHSREGCTILVKLWQMPPEDQVKVVIDTKAAGGWVAVGRGVKSLPLHHSAHETVRIVTLEAGAANSISFRGGLELFVIDGRIDCGGQPLADHDWVRFPGNGRVNLTGNSTARLFVKTGHLAAPPALPG